ncbi:hypothetical protein B0H17DRAFT_1334030, partial [Mycena rosella]
MARARRRFVPVRSSRHRRPIPPYPRGSQMPLYSRHTPAGHAARRHLLVFRAHLPNAQQSTQLRPRYCARPRGRHACSNRPHHQWNQEVIICRAGDIRRPDYRRSHHLCFFGFGIRISIRGSGRHCRHHLVIPGHIYHPENLPSLSLCIACRIQRGERVKHLGNS